jgi:hypothetical protein
LADIDLIEKTVDTAILLVDAYGQGDGMSCIMGDFLKLIAKLCGVLCR